MESPSIASTRDQSIDIIKIVAMSLVICLHTTGLFRTHAEWSLSDVLYNSGVVAIPLFFMVSGYLLIGRTDVSYRYSFKKIFQIIRLVSILVGLLWLYNCRIQGFHITTLFNNILNAFLGKGFFSVLWFLGAMCIIYLFYPVINHLQKKRIYYYSILLILAIIQNYVFILTVLGYGETHINQTFRIYNWLVYFMLGGVFKTIKISRKLSAISIGILYVPTLISIYVLNPYINYSGCEYFYSSPLVICLSTSIFFFIKSIKISNNKIITAISQLFLPVYTLQNFSLSYTLSYRHWLENFSYAGLLYWLSILILTCIISWIIMKIPIFKSIFHL